MPVSASAATIGSARALGFKDIGAIAPGMKADIVFLDLGAINWIPHHWSVNQMVHVEDGTGVRHVMIGGRFVVQDRRLLTIDLAKLALEAEAARERLEALMLRISGKGCSLPLFIRQCVVEFVSLLTLALPGGQEEALQAALRSWAMPWLRFCGMPETELAELVAL